MTARQIYKELLNSVKGTDSDYEAAGGYGGGENNGTKAIRSALL